MEMFKFLRLHKCLKEASQVMCDCVLVCVFTLYALSLLESTLRIVLDLLVPVMLGGFKGDLHSVVGCLITVITLK